MSDPGDAQALRSASNTVQNTGKNVLVAVPSMMILDAMPALEKKIMKMMGEMMMGEMIINREIFLNSAVLNSAAPNSVVLNLVKGSEGNPKIILCRNCVGTLCMNSNQKICRKDLKGALWKRDSNSLGKSLNSSKEKKEHFLVGRLKDFREIEI